MNTDANDTDEKIAVLNISPFRRGVGVGMMLALAVLLFYVAVATPPGDARVLALLIGTGALVIWQAVRLYRATRHGLYLTRKGLYETTGARLCLIGQIASVDRGFFAFKPSNGFLIRLKEPVARVWKPGLYWQFGRRIGVGGTTSPRQGKDMADVITLLTSETGDKSRLR